MMGEHKNLRVAVVGQFSSGKSALINALLGEEIAPMGVTPVTAVLHRFHWSEERTASIESLDGTTSEVPPASLITNPLSDHQLSSVREIRVGLPTGALRDLEVWDTPGFGSNTLAHELVARRALIDADIVVWVTPIDHALDREEAEKLARLRRKETPVLLVVNKADLAEDEDERDEAVSDIEADAGELASAVVWASALSWLRALQNGERSYRARFGFDKLESVLAELASQTLKANRERESLALASKIGVNDVLCPDCGAVGHFDDKFCDCGRSLEDQHRACPRCDADNTVHRQRCRGCGLSFEAWERTRALLARAEREIELGLLVDASATFAVANETLPDDGYDARQREIDLVRKKAEASMRAASRKNSATEFIDEMKRALEAYEGIGAGLAPLWTEIEQRSLSWVGERDGTRDAVSVLDFLVRGGRTSQRLLAARAECGLALARAEFHAACEAALASGAPVELTDTVDCEAELLAMTEVLRATVERREALKQEYTELHQQAEELQLATEPLADRFIEEEAASQLSALRTMVQEHLEVARRREEHDQLNVRWRTLRKTAVSKGMKVDFGPRIDDLASLRHCTTKLESRVQKVVDQERAQLLALNSKLLQEIERRGVPIDTSRFHLDEGTSISELKLARQRMNEAISQHNAKEVAAAPPQQVRQPDLSADVSVDADYGEIGEGCGRTIQYLLIAGFVLFLLAGACCGGMS